MPPRWQRGLSRNSGAPSSGGATGAPQGFAKAAGWARPSTWRQRLFFVYSSPGASAQPSQVVEPQSGEEGLKMVTARSDTSPVPTAEEPLCPPCCGSLGCRTGCGTVLFTQLLASTVRNYVPGSSPTLTRPHIGSETGAHSVIPEGFSGISTSGIDCLTSGWSSVFSACPQHLSTSLREKPAEPAGPAEPRK